MRQSVPIVVGRRNCTSCKNWRHLHEFPGLRRTRKSKSGTPQQYVVASGVCNYCKKKRERDRYADPGFRQRKIESMREHRSDPKDRKRINARRRERYQETRKWTASQRRRLHRERWQNDPNYRRSYKERNDSYRLRIRAIQQAKEQTKVIRRQRFQKAWEAKASLTPEELEIMELICGLPVEAFRPWLAKALMREAANSSDLAQWRSQGPYGEPLDSSGYLVGGKGVAQRTGIPERSIHRFMYDEDTFGVSLAVYDRLCIEYDFSAYDLIDSAREWAERESDPWPCGARGYTTALKEMRAQ